MAERGIPMAPFRCGLAVDNASGRIWAVSRERGAQFVVRLPVEPYARGVML